MDDLSIVREKHKFSAIGIKKSVMEDEIGGADEAVDCISEYMQNGFNVYVNDGAVNSIRSIVHAIDELGGDYEDE